MLTSLRENLDVIAGIENRDGNATVNFHQEDTLMRMLLNIIEQGIRIRYACVDCGSYSKEVVRLLLEHSRRIFVRAEMTRTLRGKLQEPGLKWRKTELLEQNKVFFQREVEGLTELQLNLLRAVANGVETGFGKKDVIRKYRLESSANVQGIKKSLIKKT